MSAASHGHDIQRPSLLNTVGWAFYLGVSWTWCIGMFLPILLVRDFGIGAFLVFAVPNVVGAGVMGWVLRRPGSSVLMVSRHRTACAWFSIITMLFQACFLFSLFIPVFGDIGAIFSTTRTGKKLGLLVAFLAAGVLGLLMLWRPRVACVLAWLASLGLLAAAWQLRDWTLPLPAPTLPATNLMWLAPVCVFGFLFCPYLDLTFHKARQGCSPTEGTRAFALGFGGPFLVMILGTLTYLPAALEVLQTPTVYVKTKYAYLVGAHLALQLIATIAFHAAELFRDSKEEKKNDRRAMIGGIVVGVVMVALLVTWPGGQTAGWEVGYRVFMSFYGLVFPAYVWLCMIPTADGHSGTQGAEGKRKLIVLAAAVALASPCYWMASIQQVTWWYAPGLAIVLAARLVARRESAEGPNFQSAK